MHLRSTRDCMRSASALKAATRRLSCTTWVCSRIRRRAASGAWRMASMCWQVRTPGIGAARLHLQPTHSCPALDSLLHSAASLRPPSPPSSAARSPLSPSPPPAVFSTYRCPLARCRAAAGRLRVAFQAARSCKAATTAAAAAQQRSSYHGAARAGHLRVSGGSGGALPPANRARSAARSCRKKCAHERSFCAHSRLPERAQACL